ncbi:hypothetical protein [Endozoicomonas sp. 8E]|uniref:hypothetical protein n=1 Tax=Endozoicomonas sp. 8E TaxID=3035692 RepID=UPI002938E195|nr:hypothetical protein [Endozoicomonas sp. 8E]WOG26896.1 hypothetical protein P6910_20460 [Endozoicomonas sp. 8E]
MNLIEKIFIAVTVFFLLNVQGVVAINLKDVFKYDVPLLIILNYLSCPEEVNLVEAIQDLEGMKRAVVLVTNDIADKVSHIDFSFVPETVWVDGLSNCLQEDIIRHDSQWFIIKGVPLSGLLSYSPIDRFEIDLVQSVVFYNCDIEPWTGEQWSIAGQRKDGIVFFIEGGVVDSTSVDTAGKILLAPSWMELIKNLDLYDAICLFSGCKISEGMRLLIVSCISSTSDISRIVMNILCEILSGKQKEIQDSIRQCKLQKTPVSESLTPSYIN